MKLWHRMRWRLDAYLLGEPRSPQGEAALRQHLSTCPACRAYYDGGLALMRATRAGPAAGELERLVRRAGQLGAPPPRQQPLPWRLALAAGATIMLLVVGVALLRSPVVGTLTVPGARALIGDRVAQTGDEVREGELVAAVEGVVVLDLKGGRQVTLAEGSVVAVLVSAAEVVLEAGRARFEVEPGHGAFAVRAGEVRVEVKGTVFSVARRGVADTVVAVEQGRVEVRGKQGPAVALEAGQRTRVERGAAPEAASPLRPSDLDDLRRLGEELERAFKTVGGKLRRLFR